MFFTAEIDECAGENDCHDNANCTNTVGSYNCSCNGGFEGNGTHCQGIAVVFIITHSRRLCFHSRWLVCLFVLFVCLLMSDTDPCSNLQCIIWFQHMLMGNVIDVVFLGIATYVWTYFAFHYFPVMHRRSIT